MVNVMRAVSTPAAVQTPTPPRKGAINEKYARVQESDYTTSQLSDNLHQSRSHLTNSDNPVRYPYGRSVGPSRSRNVSPITPTQVLPQHANLLTKDACCRLWHIPGPKRSSRPDTGHIVPEITMSSVDSHGPSDDIDRCIGHIAQDSKKLTMPWSGHLK